MDINIYLCFFVTDNKEDSDVAISELLKLVQIEPSFQTKDEKKETEDPKHECQQVVISLEDQKHWRLYDLIRKFILAELTVKEKNT